MHADEGDEPHADHGADEHVHGHSHAHGDVIGWQAFRRNKLLQAVLVFIAAAAVACVVGIIALWPSGAGQAAAVQQGADMGLGSDRYAATVIEVVDRVCSYSTSERQQNCREVTFEVTEGPFEGETFTFAEFNLEFDAIAPDVTPGDGIIAGHEASTDFWFYADLDRRGPLIWLALLFAVVVVALGRFRGAAALVGMAATVAVLVGFVAPSVLDGNDPLLVAVVAAVAIAFVSLYLTHGFNATTTVALAGTLLSLGLTLALTSLFFALSRFTGLASEEALLLPFIAGEINLGSLLLGGAVLGTLGALDDVTVTQVATVAELHRRSPELSVRDLMVSGIKVGREHIASTVNTLLLAYAGASMPLLLLFAASEQSLGKVANAELLSVEIVRTLCGSIGLVAAVPVTTALVALTTERRARSGSAIEPTAGGTAIEMPTAGISEGESSAFDPHADRNDRDPGPSSEAVDGSDAAIGEPASWDDFAPREDESDW